MEYSDVRDFDPSPEQIKGVYARFGLAMYFCQCIERQLATLLVTKYGPDVRSLTQSQYDERLQSLFKKTLGTLLKRLHQSAKVSEDFEVALGKTLEHRNWLAHNYFWDRAGYFMTSSGCLSMMQELQEVIDFLDHFENQVRTVLKEWALENVVSEEMIESEMTKLIGESTYFL